MEVTTESWRSQSGRTSKRLLILLIGLALIFVGHIFAGANYFIRQATLVPDFQTAFRVTLALERTRGLLSALGAEALSINASTDREAAARSRSQLANLERDIKASVRIWSPELRASPDDDALQQRMLKIADLYVQFAAQTRVQDLSAWAERGTLENEQRELQRHVEDLLLRQSRKVADIDALDASLSKAAFPMFVLGSLGLCSGLMLAVYVHGHLAKPLRELVRIAANISDHVPILYVPHLHRRDEVGAIAQIVKLLQHLTYRNIDLNKISIIAKRDQEKASESEARAVKRLNLIMDNINCGILIIDNYGEATFNAAYRKIYDIKIAGSKIKFAEIKQHLAKKELLTPSAAAEQMVGAGRRSYHTMLADGRVIRVKECPLPSGDSLSLHEDSTERRTIKRQLERAERLLGVISENIGDAVLARDPQSRLYVFANGAAETLLGVKRDSIIGRKASEIIGSAAAERMEDDDDPLFGTGQTKSERQDIIETPANGRRRVTIRDLDMNAGEGFPGYLVSVIREVTEFGVTMGPIRGAASG